jgi:putative NADH-flavin reductase
MVRLAETAGHTVTAFARGANLKIDPSVRVAWGDARDASTVDAAVMGQDAVLSALGSRSLRRSDLLETSILNIIGAMHRNNARRLVVLGAAGALDDAGVHQSFVGKALLLLLARTSLRQVFRDQAAMERQVKISGMDFTVVCPPFLTNAPASGRWRIDSEGLPPKWKPISRSDVAAFMVGQLEDSTFVRRRVYISG